MRMLKGVSAAPIKWGTRSPDGTAVRTWALMAEWRRRPRWQLAFPFLAQLVREEEATVSGLAGLNE